MHHAIDTLRQDLRFAFRQLRRRPGFTGAAVVTLGLGIGATAAIFSLVNAILFRPLPVPEADELVVVAQQWDGVEFPLAMSYADFRDLRAESDLIEDLIVYAPTPVSLESDGAPRRQWMEVVSANYFDMLGVRPALGRGFGPEEAVGAGGGSASLVLSHRFWQQRFGGDSAVVGRTVRLNGYPFTVVGVAPEDFLSTEFLIQPEGYVPAAAAPWVLPSYEDLLRARDWTFFRMMGRLREGASVEQAREELATIADELARRYPDEKERYAGLVVLPETSARPEPAMAGTLPPIAGIFLGLVGLVLLIACANVANLLLARAAGRRRELAVRSALGAGRGRILRQLLTESVLLGLGGAVLGLGLAYLVSGFLGGAIASWPTDIPLQVELAPDARVFAFTAALAVLTGVVAGGLPALRASREDVSSSLKEGGRSDREGAGRSWIRNGLVVAQTAVCLVVLVAGGLFLRSLHNARQVPLGFRTSGLLMGSADPSLLGYPEDQSRRLYEDVRERLAGLPGARSASYAGWTPFGGTTRLADLSSDVGPTAAEDRSVSGVRMSVGPGYFRTLGSRLLRGRGIEERDAPDGRPVAVVNRAAAERLWPERDALGQRVRRGGEDGPWAEVVGVVENGKFIFLWEEDRPAIYVPASQSPPVRATFYVHTDGDPLALSGGFRNAVRAVAPDVSVYGVRSMETHLRDGTAFLLVRMAALLAGAFGLLGLVLAAVGLYGVVAYTVSRRGREFAIRMALGAGATDVRRLVLGRGTLVSAVGLALGLAAVLAVMGPMGDLLIGVGPTDPLTIGAAAAFLLAVSLLAAWLPARRAAGVAPADTLRAG